MRRSSRRIAAALAATVCLLTATACNRAGARIPFASGSFHPARTGYVAKQASSRVVRLAFPLDAREGHYGEPVAGTDWEACATDPFLGTSAAQVLATELEREVASSGIFRGVSSQGGADELVLETEIRAMCAQAVGFIYLRVAGITSLHFTLREGDEVVFDRTIERVVTDVDPEYTGGSVGFIEQVMKVLISDSLREVLRELMPALDQVVNP